MTNCEAIENLRNAKYLLGFPDQGVKWKANAETIAIDLAIQVLREKMECENQPDGWISIKDRLPEEYEKIEDVFDSYTYAVVDARMHSVSDIVNVTVKDHEDGEVFVSDDCTVDGEWSNFGGDGGRFEVIAWQPLPKLYVPKEGNV